MDALFYRGTVGYILSTTSILWSTYAASGIFVTVLRMSDQRLLVNLITVRVRVRTGEFGILGGMLRKQSVREVEWHVRRLTSVERGSRSQQKLVRSLWDCTTCQRAMTTTQQQDAPLAPPYVCIGVGTEQRALFPRAAHPGRALHCRESDWFTHHTVN